MRVGPRATWLCLGAGAPGGASVATCIARGKQARDLLIDQAEAPMDEKTSRVASLMMEHWLRARPGAQALAAARCCYQPPRSAACLPASLRASLRALRFDLCPLVMRCDQSDQAREYAA